MRAPTLNRNMATEVVEETPAIEREFSHHDRCDRCGFQAYFVFVRPRTEKPVGDGIKDETTQEIVLCNNHATVRQPSGVTHAKALESAGWTVLDFSEMLDKPLVSANVD